MELKDANKEIERLLPILHQDVYIEENRFHNIPEAEVFKLEQYLGYTRLKF